MYILSPIIVIINISSILLLFGLPSYMSIKVPCSKSDEKYCLTYGDLFWHNFVRDPVGYIILLATMLLLTSIVFAGTIWALDSEILKEYRSFSIPLYVLCYMSLIGRTLISMRHGYLRYKTGMDL